MDYMLAVCGGKTIRTHDIPSEVSSREQLSLQVIYRLNQQGKPAHVTRTQFYCQVLLSVSPFFGHEYDSVVLEKGGNNIMNFQQQAKSMIGKRVQIHTTRGIISARMLSVGSDFLVMSSIIGGRRRRLIIRLAEIAFLFGLLGI
jgi:hypothetical protein